MVSLFTRSVEDRDVSIDNLSYPDVTDRRADRARGRSSQVWWTVTHRVVNQLALGLVLGLTGAAAIGRLLDGYLWGVGEHDPLTFVSVTTPLVVVGLVASFLPARRAMRLDPVATLRAE